MIDLVGCEGFSLNMAYMGSVVPPLYGVDLKPSCEIGLLKKAIWEPFLIVDALTIPVLTSHKV